MARLRNPVVIGALALGALALLAAIVFAIDSGGDGDVGTSAEKITGPLPDRGGLEFVVQGPATVDNEKLAIETDAVEWFTDSPKRKAGVAEVTQLADAWDDYGFVAIPPNAAVAGGDTDVVVELAAAETTSEGIAFEFKALDGELRSGELGDVSAFIDSSNYSCFADFYNRTEYTLDIDPGNTDPSVGSAGWDGGPADSLPADDQDAPQSAHMVFNENGTLTSTGAEASATDVGQGGHYNPLQNDPSGIGNIHYVVAGKGSDGPGVWPEVGCKVDDDGNVKFMDADGDEVASACEVSDDFAATCSIERSDKEENHGKFFINPN